MFLGIDLGTSSVKAVLIDDHQTVVAQAACPLTVSSPHPLWSEQDPKLWWEALCQVMKKLSSKVSAVKAIGLSGQQHGAVLLDKKGEPLRAAILWNDGRSFAQCRQLEESVGEYGNITGNRIMPGFTAPKVLWVKQNESEIFGKTAKVLLPKDYLRFKMTGVFASDMSDASGTSWLDVGKRKWSEKMLAATGLSVEQMPLLFEGPEITGVLKASLAEEWGMPSGIPVIAGGGDNAAAAISANVIKPAKAFLSLGTSGVYFVSSAYFKPNPTKGVHTFCHCLPKLWHQMSVHLSAASCLSWFAKVMKLESVDPLLREAEEEAILPGKLLFLPYLTGERSPHNDPYARGVFFGLSANTQRADMTQAILEGVAFAFADGQEGMLEAGIPIEEVSVIGGGARSDYWGKILASVLGRPLIYREDREIGAAMGAAKLAWLAIHGADPQTALTTPPIEMTIEPDPTLMEHYFEKRQLFKELYRQLKELFQKALT